MTITPGHELQICQPDGHWRPVPLALDVDAAGGLAQVADAHGAIHELVGVFRVVEISTGAVVDTSVPEWAPHSSMDGLCADQILVEKSEP